ncbi:MAG: non-heme iron oxygenase ferredoxin subunit [Burkholderiales bacterium]|jgi:3-phenylpropionate/trans-cinnamate dioxygenase ferredoxin subunit
MSDWVEVADASAIAPGQWEQVDLDGTLVAVFNVDGEFHAIEDICTHDGAVLSGCPLEGDEVVCPRHGARFSVKTGEVLAPPAWEPVATFPCKIENGKVLLRDERWD